MTANTGVPDIGPLQHGTSSSANTGHIDLGPLQSNPEVDASITLVGVAGTGHAGSISDEVDETLSGVAGTGQVGSVAAVLDSSQALTGVAGTGAVGSVADEVDETASGVSGAGQAGTVLAGYDASITLVGVAATGTAGDALDEVDEAALGVNGTGVAGVLAEAYDANLSLVGVAGTGAAGNVFTSPLPIIGVSGTGRAGDVLGIANLPLLHGVNGDGEAGTLSVTGDIAVRASQAVLEALAALRQASPAARAGQSVLEALAGLVRAAPTVRASQIALEALAGQILPAPRCYAGQIVLEALVTNWRVPMPDIYPDLPGLAFTVVKRPNWGTVTDQAASGREVRVGYYTAPLWDFELNYDLLNDRPGFTELKRLVGFYNKRMGSLAGFLFKDPDDNTVARQLIGVGDATTGDFVLQRSYGSEDGQSDEESTVTITAASPAVVSWTDHGLVAGNPVRLSTTGALLTGLSPNVTYYVLASGLTADSFELAATPGGSAINTSGTQSGVHTAYAVTSTADFSGTEPVGYVDLMQPFQLYVNGVAKDRTDATYGYTVIRTPFVGNLIRFNTAPLVADVISVDMSFYYYVRFADDSLDFTKFMHLLWNLGKVKLTSLRE